MTESHTWELHNDLKKRARETRKMEKLQCHVIAGVASADPPGEAEGGLTL